MSDHMLHVSGKRFHCQVCGANVFSKSTAQGEWICNGCGTKYCDETYVEPKKTNADRIRAMSDEELAQFIFELYELPLEDGYIDWLRKPAEED